MFKLADVDLELTIFRYLQYTGSIFAGISCFDSLKTSQCLLSLLLRCVSGKVSELETEKEQRQKAHEEKTDLEQRHGSKMFGMPN